MNALLFRDGVRGPCGGVAWLGAAREELPQVSHSTEQISTFVKEIL